MNKIFIFIYMPKIFSENQQFSGFLLKFSEKTNRLFFSENFQEIRSFPVIC
jgi:hypothetical protein